jgi:dsRNA-specific ribonuclease
MRILVIQSTTDVNAKARLHDLFQAKLGASPDYRIIRVAGPPDERVYTVEISFEGNPLASATGGSPSRAGEAAAAILEAELKRGE